MQEKHLFEYAVIRVVPRVEREEFINVGIILFCKKQRFLRTLFEVNKERLLAFANHLDVEEVEAYLKSFERICKGTADSGPIGKLDLPSRFRWLTATRSTIVQVSKVHPGFCADLDAAIQKLYRELVL